MITHSPPAPFTADDYAPRIARAVRQTFQAGLDGLLVAPGAGGPGQRPVLAESKVVQGELLIIGIYWPEQLSEFQRFVDSLRIEGGA